MALVDLKSNLSTAFKKAPVDAFPDKTSGAKGFTENFTDPNNTQFIGVKGRQYIYPVTVTGIHRNSVMEVATGNSRFDFGIAKLNNQLGNGSPFRYVRDRFASAVKVFSSQGYSETAPYSNFVRVADTGPELSLLYKRGMEQNSPSAIEEQYKKYNLRDEAFNFQYMRHPLILRGIQRKGNEKPQRWGVDALVNFDDGLIRGGATTVAERAAIDTARIAKWMASPRGLLWAVKQVGLGLSNPKVEAIGGALTRQTRIHTGLASLLSVPGTALGLHFTRHGIPFANELASYENVIKGKQYQKTLAGSKIPYSRLIDLQDDYATGEVYSSKIKEVAGKLKIIKTKSLGSTILSGLAGTQSVYGIGNTQIRRVVDTKSDASKNAARQNFVQVYSAGSQYASLQSTSRYKTSENTQDTLKDTGDNTVDNLVTKFGISNTKLLSRLSEAVKEAKLKEKRVSIKDKLDIEYPESSNSTPGSQVNTTKVDLSTAAARNNVYKGKTISPTGINNYVTLAYNKIPKDKDKKPFRDFREDIDNSGAVQSLDESYLLGTGTIKDYYKNNNLETKYGFGNLGQVGVDRTNPGEFLVTSNVGNNKFDGTNKTREALSKLYGTTFRGDKITAIDRSSQKSGEKIEKDKIYPENTKDLIEFYFEDGDAGYSVMPFRAIITGLSDSFSPGWNRIDIMGRPDGAYLYSSFERSLSFTFTVAALSRSEMIPMWRKLNYLASYTMPDFNASGGRPNGPFMRLTIGDMFKSCPGFLESLTYTVPDEATWDIAQDKDTYKDAKQLPTMIEVSVTFKVVHDKRPQLHGEVYYLNESNTTNVPGNWLMDIEGGDLKAYKEADEEKPK